MLWYVAFTKEPGIHRVIDDPGFVYPNMAIRKGIGLPSDSDQWALPKVESEERNTTMKLETLEEWMFEHRAYLRDNPVRYKALQELIKRFERRLNRLKELKNALVQKRQ